MTYTTVKNLSINSNYRILAAELNYRFTKTIKLFGRGKAPIKRIIGIGNDCLQCLEMVLPCE